jgi:hypothetical protein
MPKHIQARAAEDEQEDRLVRKLARSHHVPAEMVVASGYSTTQPPHQTVDLDGFSKHDASCIVSFGIAFEERSTKDTPLPPTV